MELTGKLSIIDLGGTFELEAAMAVLEGVPYVPASLFELFFDEVTVSEEAVSISEVVYHTCDGQEDAAADYYSIVVNSKHLQTGKLPFPAYEENGVIMLPLRMVGEALGYNVAWNPENGEITMESGIQKVALRGGSFTARFTGKLTNINLSGTIELETAVTTHAGSTYVPASLFELFFNEVCVEDMVISVSPGMNELH